MIRTLLVSTLVTVLPAFAAVSEPGGLSPRLRASASEEPAFSLAASGVQVYECRAAPEAPGGYMWKFTNPDATLSDGSGSVARNVTATVYEAISDRSSITATVRATQPAGTDDLPWTAMRAQTLAEEGLFAGVTSVQRVNTHGGVAPRDGCGEGTVGNEARVAFTADYYFYKRRAV